MRYDAVTIDTNIFRQASWNLEGGILSKLSQFKTGSVQFVLSEVVLREVHKYLKDEASRARKLIEDVKRSPVKSGVLPLDIMDRINHLFEIAVSPEDAARNRLQTFIDNTGLTIVPTDNVDTQELVKRYFLPSPPFKPSGAKKSEFPDAIALLSLENWAKLKEKKILAISRDSDWSDFAEQSPWIDVNSDVAGALQELQEHAQETRQIVADLLLEASNSHCHGLFREISDGIANAVGELDVYAEASSDYRYDGDWVALHFHELKLPEFDDDSAFTFLQIGRKHVVIQASATIIADAVCEFTFSVWDSIDKEYMPMGDSTAEVAVEFGATILLTLEGDYSVTKPSIKLSDVEIIEAIESVDFGYITIDYAKDDYLFSNS